MNRQLVAGLAAAAFAAAVLGQDSSPDAAAASPPNPADLKPRPSEMAPLAAHSLLLAVTKAGDHFVAVGDRGDILLSADGTSWQQVASPVHATLTTVAFVDASNGWAAGHDEAILHTSDGGKTWSLQNFKPQDNKPVLTLLALDAQRVYAAGAYGLLLSTSDGGAHWQPMDAPPILQDGRHLNALTRLGDGELFLAGETGLIGVSKDGAAWTRLKLPYDGSLFGALPRGDKGALVYGLRGNVYVSDDVHTNAWRKIDTRTVASFFGGTLLDGGDAVLVGADGEVVRVAPNGAVSNARVNTDERTLGSGTLSAVLPRDGELLVVGELGVGRIKAAVTGAPASASAAAPAPVPAPTTSPAPAPEPTPAPAAPPVHKKVPKPAAESPPSRSPSVETKPTQGADVTLGKSLALHARPTDTTTSVATLHAGSVAKLKSQLAKPTGTWWYVSAPAGSGWVTDAELKAALGHPRD